MLWYKIAFPYCIQSDFLLELCVSWDLTTAFCLGLHRLANCETRVWLWNQNTAGAGRHKSEPGPTFIFEVWFTSGIKINRASRDMRKFGEVVVQQNKHDKFLAINHVYEELINSIAWTGTGKKSARQLKKIVCRLEIEPKYFDKLSPNQARTEKPVPN